MDGGLDALRDASEVRAAGRCAVPRCYTMWAVRGSGVSVRSVIAVS